MNSPVQTHDCFKLLRPEALQRLNRLELIARGAVEGFVTGRHTSPYKGFSVEFAEHRQYAPGDDVRDLDWRVYGKSDRYYIKQYIEETNLRSTVVLDASGSMSYAGTRAATVDGQPLSKFEYGRYLAASLAYMMINQQDAVGLVTCDTQVRRYIPARSRASHLRAILDELHRTEPGGDTTLADILHDVAERVHRRGLVFIISDLFDDEQQVLNALHHFRYRKHEVVLFHLLAEEEISFPFNRYSEFRDLEGDPGRLELDPRTIRAEYLDRMNRFVDQVRQGCGRMHVDYVPINTTQPYEVALSEYLADRAGR